MTVRSVFVVMPFSEQSVATSDGRRTYPEQHFDDIYVELKSAVLEHDANIDVQRMENEYGNIVSQIIRKLADADVVIAVLSGRNPNVFYELGIRHSLRRNTIMLVEHMDEYPFDLSSHFSKKFSVEYHSDREELREFIKERLSQYDDETLPDSPVFEVLNQAEYDQTRAINAWETRRAAVVLHGLIGEVGQFFNVVLETFDVLAELEESEAAEVDRPQMEILWDMIEGFRHNRPMPGLPIQAYVDAENTYRFWRNMEAQWNDLMSSDEPLDIDTIQTLTATPFIATCAFAFDLLLAAEYVMHNRTSFAIPWNGSSQVVQEYEFEPDQLNVLFDKSVAHLYSVMDQLAVFDREFIGVPADAIIALSERTAATEAGFDQILAEIGATRVGESRDGAVPIGAGEAGDRS